jgi:DNA-binding transcriptional LysR family regulator
VGFNKDLVIRREVDRFLREQAVAVNVVMEFDNIENIKKAVEISAGVALLPEPTIRPEVQAGTLRAVPLASGRFVRPLGIIHGRHHKLNTSILRFIDLLRDGDENGGSGRPDSNGKHNGTRLRKMKAGKRRPSVSRSS